MSEAILLTHEDWLADRLACSRHAFRSLVAAIAGHHGRPPSATADHWQRMLDKAGAEALADAATIVKNLCGMLAECQP